MEKCSRLHGFLIVHSVGGGTGSGVGTATLKLLADDYSKVDRYCRDFSTRPFHSDYANY